MGDMADMAIQDGMTYDELYMDYTSGRMSLQDAMDCGIVDHHGCVATVTTKSCRCCGKSGLVWMNSKGKWLLGDGSKVHECPANPYKEKESNNV